MAKRDPNETARNRMIQELKEKRRDLQPAVFEELEAIEEGKYCNEASLNAFIGSKTDEYLNLHDAVIHTPTEYVSKWLRGLKMAAATSKMMGTDPRHLRMHQLITGKYPNFKRYVNFFLQSSFLKHYDEHYKTKPKLDESAFWFGNNGDYFASRLAAPLEQLKAASAQMSEHVQSAATGATEAATVLSVAIRKLKAKTEQAEESLDTVVRLTTAQHSLFDTSAAQLERLQRLGDLLDQVQKALDASTKASVANATSNEEVQGRVTAVVLAVEASQKAVVEAIGKLLTRQGVEQDAASSLERQVQSAEAATKELTNELRNNFAVAQRLAARLEAEASPQPQLIAVVGELQAQRESMSEVLSSIDRKASSASIEAAAAVAQLRGVGERLDELVSRLVARPLLPEISGITGP